MSDPVSRLAAAEAAAALAHERLHFSLQAVQARLEPARLAEEARRGLSEARMVATQRTADAARRNPGALAGGVALAGLFLARHRLAALFRR